MSNETAIEMFVGGILLDPNTNAPVVVLKDESGQICLPIWIGLAEATSIASVLKKLQMARPLTHDLMHTVFQEIGVRLERVMITELRDSTYFAELVFALGEKAIIVDARPSDAIALALREQSPIFVAQQVLDQAKIAFAPAEAAPEQGGEPKSGEASKETKPEEHPALRNLSNLDREKWSEILEELNPDDFKYKM